jgi:hypothetical protein
MTARFKAACSFLRSISLRSVSLAAGCDFVVLSIAGHGVWEPEHVKAPQPDGLAGFNRKTPAANQQRIIGTEINHVIKQFESKGAHVMFVADAWYGGGLAREMDSRAAEMRQRQV